MLTWAIVWLIASAGVNSTPAIMMLFAMFGDVAIFFMIACTFQGWPK